MHSAPNASRRILIAFANLMVLAVMMPRCQLAPRRVRTLLLMTRLRRSSAVAPHLHVASDVFLASVRLEVVHVADRLTHLARRDDLGMLHAGAEA